MLMMKKKDVFKELAFSLFLVLEFDRDTTAMSLIRRIHERAREALRQAAVYTGTFGDKDAQTFLATRPLDLSIDCGSDIIKGDTIRFIEHVYNNRKKPVRHIGRRSVVAVVEDVTEESGNTMLNLRVISCQGVWELKSGTQINRLLRTVTRTEVKRAPRSSEAKHGKITSSN